MLGAGHARRPRRGPRTTSTAIATARSRSGGRGGQAADKDATRPGRGCRPNCRSHRRPNRPSGLICASGLPVSVSKVPPWPVIGIGRRIDRRRFDGVAERRHSRGGAFACRPRRGISPTFRDWLWRPSTICSGTPHQVWLSTRNFITMASAATKMVISLQTSLRSALACIAFCTALAFFCVAWFSVWNLLHCGGAGACSCADAARRPRPQSKYRECHGGRPRVMLTLSRFPFTVPEISRSIKD